jgi:hypothetical protein
MSAPATGTEPHSQAGSTTPPTPATGTGRDRIARQRPLEETAPVRTR